MLTELLIVLILHLLSGEDLHHLLHTLPLLLLLLVRRRVPAGRPGLGAGLQTRVDVLHLLLGLSDHVPGLVSADHHPGANNIVLEQLSFKSVGQLSDSNLGQELSILVLLLFLSFLLAILIIFFLRIRAFLLALLLLLLDDIFFNELWRKVGGKFDSILTKVLGSQCHGHHSSPGEEPH